MKLLYKFSENCIIFVQNVLFLYFTNFWLNTMFLILKVKYIFVKKLHLYNGKIF